MKAAYERGVSIADIAASAGLSYSWTRRKLIEHGVEITCRSRRTTPVPVEQLATEYLAGDSILAIAQRYEGLYYKLVRDLLLEQGVKLRASTRAHRTMGVG
ncbi:helix-turn-helix domain-containing protein [Amycolatopsis sp. NPDC005961]|uniref:helix-turn-helix domain-containing protein n=1 Tax=Amycolatopsis sp. NPDC005961 TaxID=3156720 RepID=UPI0033D167CA